MMFNVSIIYQNREISVTIEECMFEQVAGIIGLGATQSRNDQKFVYVSGIILSPRRRMRTCDDDARRS